MPVLASEIQFNSLSHSGTFENITLDLALGRDWCFHQAILLKSNFGQVLNFNEKSYFSLEKKCLK